MTAGPQLINAKDSINKIIYSFVIERKDLNGAIRTSKCKGFVITRYTREPACSRHGPVMRERDFLL